MSDESRFYTTLQYQDFVDEDNNSRSSIENNKVFAKAIKNGLSRDMTKSGGQYFRYYVRCSPNKTLHDPFPKYSVSDNKQSFIDKVCKSENTYREVTPSVFEKYINYLKTESLQWLKSAQNEFNNNSR